MTAFIVLAAIVLIVLAIGSAVVEREREDVVDRTPKRVAATPAGTASPQPSPLGEALGSAIEAAAEAGSDRSASSGAHRPRREGDSRDAHPERSHHAVGTGSVRTARAERDDDTPRGSSSSGDSGDWCWGGFDD